MASPDLKIPVGDLTPPLEANLKDGNDFQNLHSVLSVVAFFQLWRSTEAVLEYDCEVTDADTGLVEIDWSLSGNAPPPEGLYRVWFVVTFSTGLPQSFPQERDLLIEFWTHGVS